MQAKIYYKNTTELLEKRLGGIEQTLNIIKAASNGSVADVFGGNKVCTSSNTTVVKI